jgi:hypothetical protein
VPGDAIEYDVVLPLLLAPSFSESRLSLPVDPRLFCEPLLISGFVNTFWPYPPHMVSARVFVVYILTCVCWIPTMSFT